MRRFAHAPAALVLLCCVWLCSCEAHVPLHVLSGEAMGTTWTIKLIAPKRYSEERTRLEIDSTLQRMDEQMSTWRSDSTSVNEAQPHI